jgi:hypothetical protein
LKLESLEHLELLLLQQHVVVVKGLLRAALVEARL